jgi:hypothetical protein
VGLFKVKTECGTLNDRRNASVEMLHYKIIGSMFRIPDHQYIMGNGVCREKPYGGWNDMFEWLQSPMTKYIGMWLKRAGIGERMIVWIVIEWPCSWYLSAGSWMVLGHLCNVWKLDMQVREVRVQMALAADSNQLWQINSSFAVTAGSTFASVSYHDDFKAAKPTTKQVMPPERCYGDGFICMMARTLPSA